MYRIVPVFFVAVVVAGVVFCARSAADLPAPKVIEATFKIYSGTRQ